LEKREYKPGESGVITAMLKTDHYYGKVSKGIMVTTDSVSTPAVRLNLVAYIYAELKPLNTNLRFRNVTVGKTFTQRIMIENNMDKPLKILDVKLNTKMMRDQSYKITAEVQKENGKEFIAFNLEKTNVDYHFNNISIPITVTTNSKGVPEITFYAIVKLQKPIEIDPSSIYMYSTKIGTKRVKRITIKSNMEKPIKIESIESTNMPLTFEEVSESETVKHIWVGVNNKAIPGRLSGIIIINLKHGNENKRYTIPLRGTTVTTAK